jgi:hypothetical protein
MEKRIYNYHPNTGEYLGVSFADPDPMNDGQFLIPANATEIEPPESASNTVAVFSEGTWSLVPDHRGETWFMPDRSPIEINEIGVMPDPEWTNAPAPLTVNELISNQLNAVNGACELAIAQISAGYPASEVLSWPKQETEARAWLANNSAATPLIDALASTRGVPKTELVSRIIEKADLFAQVSGQLIGQRQAREDQLDALLARHEDPENTIPVTNEEIEAIAWPA